MLQLQMIPKKVQKGPLNKLNDSVRYFNSYQIIYFVKSGMSIHTVTGCFDTESANSSCVAIHVFRWHCLKQAN